jgi:hypothetical protein
MQQWSYTLNLKSIWSTVIALDSFWLAFTQPLMEFDIINLRDGSIIASNEIEVPIREHAGLPPTQDSDILRSSCTSFRG